MNQISNTTLVILLLLFTPELYSRRKLTEKPAGCTSGSVSNKVKSR